MARSVAEQEEWLVVQRAARRAAGEMKGVGRVAGQAGSVTGATVVAAEKRGVEAAG